MLITEYQVIAQFQEFLTSCDRDELARLTGELFGGTCFPMYGETDGLPSTNYEFEPNDDYCGAFGE